MTHSSGCARLAICLNLVKFVDNLFTQSPPTSTPIRCLYKQVGGVLKMKLRNLVLGLGVAALSLSVGAMASEQTISEQGIARIQKQVRHELNMLPYVNVFDYMTFTVDENGNVTLNGEVTNPMVKSDAANVVKRVEGVERVDNKIQVLPLSFFDNRLRARLYH